jgi:hypothetical protein
LPQGTKAEKIDREEARQDWISRKKTIDAMGKAVVRKRHIAEKSEARHRANMNAIFYRGRSYNRYWTNRPNVRYSVRSIFVQTPTGNVRYWIPTY